MLLLFINTLYKDLSGRNLRDNLPVIKEQLVNTSKRVESESIVMAESISYELLSSGGEQLYSS